MEVGPVMANESSSQVKAEAGHRAPPLADDEVGRWLLPVGTVARLATYALIFCALWQFRPSDISDVPLGSLTISQISTTMIWIAVGLTLVKALLTPAGDETARQGWGVLGLVMIGALAIAAVFWAGAIR
jgi:hypothetical protein